MPIQPRIEEPSNPSPSSNVPASQRSIGNEQCCHEPSRSTNFRSTISALFFFANSRNSLGDITHLASVTTGTAGGAHGAFWGPEHNGSCSPRFQVPGSWFRVLVQGSETVLCEPGTRTWNLGTLEPWNRSVSSIPRLGREAPSRAPRRGPARRDRCPARYGA